MKDEDASRIVNEQEDLSPGPRRLGREKNPPMYHHEHAGIITLKHTVTLKEVLDMHDPWKPAAVCIC
jgi:hypothetical protein